jgi:hypothetical protein
MTSHLKPRHAARWLVLAGTLLVAACAGPSPQVKVLGAEQGRVHRPGARVLTVFVEVVNPTGRDLALSRLEYDFQAKDVFAERGHVDLDRRIGAGSTAVVEIPVPVDARALARMGGVPYRLVGRLYAQADPGERFWSVSVKGELEATTVAGDHVLRVKLGPSSR